jgi:hypothetical protein
MSSIYEYSRDINPLWIPDEHHLDIGGSKVPGRKEPTPPLHRYIGNSDWARSKGLVGKDIRSLRVTDLCYKNCDNWYMRMASAGRACQIEFTRNIRESLLTQAVLQEVRGYKDVNLDTLAAEADDSYDKKNKVGKAQYEVLARKMIAAVIHDKTETTSQELLDRIRNLEQENSSLRHKNDFPTTPPPKKPPNKDMRAFFGCQTGGSPDKEDDKEAEDPATLDSQATVETLRCSDRQRILGSQGPTATSKQQISKWMDAAVPQKNKKKILESLVKDMDSTWSQLPKSTRPDLRTWAIEWGMPFDIAAKILPAELLKILCTATVITE